MERRHLSVADNIDDLLGVLPEDIRRKVAEHPQLPELLEVVLDLGRMPEARFQDEGFVFLRDTPISDADISYVSSRIGEFGNDNRAGIERTLHRISALRNRRDRIVGLTCRVGRAVYGTIDIIRDIVESGMSILFLGRPGVGKTTKLREVARVLSDEFRKRVVIVDTSNEIAGDGDIPHAGIGYARRMQVASPEKQHDVMIEAVENHMPEVVVIDEIGRSEEAYAARTIAERGVQLIATAHGTTLENLLMNPTLSDLVGGIQSVTLSDDEARRRSTQKTVLERKAPPTFDVVIELVERDKLALHRNVGEVVDALLRGRRPQPEIRQWGEDGEVEILQTAVMPQAEESAFAAIGRSPGKRKRLYPYGVSRNRLEKAIESLGMEVEITRTWQEADAILTLKAHYRKDSPKLKEAVANNKPIYVVRSNTYAQILALLHEIYPGGGEGTQRKSAVQEAESAVQAVLKSREPSELSPQNAALRRLQHELAGKNHLRSYSVGHDPNRRVRILPA
ncbi:MAG: single-stranded DNA-binding protein [Armatimonadetes bacterium CG2_30_59_28]|nr:AAA family ATPase [Armatimonadota bacterium]OIO95029.1 MAG: single-stranded DNA-binding protein [Armatimonadetes bacterium CG2_30_59_28]PIU67508.1 MAG: single-stranded DNA-binding protein [Armatimonadetes bacterium CG07_land_8_20_14_0_80_59_28]PIX39307.1 MAG: single-stranded DNA-binding protein [Armatimonadetes bacterium CG_4_8_14_3_um_filter_58_9]PIY48659.1 MAG: single-stranded DNA-binding protein [Armatimonadetes bacterium CG_4_10_14_3_um_filter_59_10]PJB76325.1 MAG: single-stranded DNA-b